MVKRTSRPLPTGLLRITRQYLDESTTVMINPTPDPIAIEVLGEVLTGEVVEGELQPYGCIAMVGQSSF